MHRFFAIWIIAALTVFSLATSAFAQEVERTVPGGACTVPPLENWTEGEKWAWERICTVGGADMQEFSGDDAGCLAWGRGVEAPTWPESRTLSARFLKTISIDDRFIPSLGHKWLSIRCAAIDGNLNFAGETVALSLGFLRTRFPDGISFRNANVPGDLTFMASDLGKSGFDAQGLVLQGTLELSELRAKQLVLADAKISGTVGLSGTSFAWMLNAERMQVAGNVLISGADLYVARFEGANIGANFLSYKTTVALNFLAGRMRVGGDFFLGQEATFENLVHLDDAQIGGSLRADNSTFKGRVDANRIKVSGGMYLSDGAIFEKGIDLYDAHVGARVIANGSTFNGPFNADGIHVGSSLFLRDGAVFAERVDLENARIAGDIWADGSTFKGQVDLDRAIVSGSVYLHDGTTFEKGIDLLDARVEGSLVASGSTFNGEFDADRVQVGGGVFLRNGAVFAEGVDLNEARIGGSIHANGSTFNGRFNAENIQISHDVYLNGEANFGDWVSFRAAEIGGNLSANGTAFSDLFTAKDLKIDGSVDLSDGASFDGWVSFYDADIGRHLDLSGAVFRSNVYLDFADVGGSILLTAGRSHAAWEGRATLILFNAHAGHFQAKMPVPGQQVDHPWRRKVEVEGSEQVSYQPLPVDLDGFTYDSASIFTEAARNDIRRIRVDHAIAWLAQSVAPSYRGAERFNPGPYLQLASVLRDMGSEDAAQRVDFARLKLRMETRTDSFHKVADGAALVFLGFGLYPEFALYWLTFLTLLGWVVTRRSPELSQRGSFERLFYSLENTLPLLRGSEDFRGVGHGDRPAVANFFRFQKIAGFLLVVGIILVLVSPVG